MNKEVVIVAALRTPIGAFGGTLKNISAIELGATVAKAIIKQTNLNAETIDEVIFGNVLRAGLGQNVARQIAIQAGIPEHVPAFSIDMVCGSGLKAIELGAQKIQTGNADIMLVGGTENMSQAPYVLETARWGSRMGNTTTIDTLLKDGLTDAFSNIHMGVTAENIVKQYHFTREMLDDFAYQSQQKAIQAINDGKFNDEIVPIAIQTKKGDIQFSQDEFPKFDITRDALANLKPVFVKENGTVTAGSSSGINDGAAAVLLMSREKAETLKLPILASIVSCASAGVSPEIMGCGPIPATKKALEKANLTINDIDLFEANEAFAAQALAVAQDLALPMEKVNVNGGAIALGHPIGASGTRIMVTLVHELQKRNGKFGVATLCIGGGQGETIIIQNDTKS